MMTNELYHHGIKGQKWGVRRYQNLDRSLTPAGKERYGRGTGEKIKSAVKTVGREVANAGKAVGRGVSTASKAVGSKISESYKKKHPNRMSDAELKAYISRLQMEKQVKQLQAELNPEREHKIRKRIAGIMDVGINKITNRAWDEVVKNLFDKSDAITNPDEVLSNPDRFTDKQVEAAKKRDDNLNAIRKNKAQDIKYDPNNIKPISEMTARELGNYLDYEGKRKRANEALKQTDEYRAGRSALDDWLGRRDAYNRVPPHATTEEQNNQPKKNDTSKQNNQANQPKAHGIVAQRAVIRKRARK